MGKVSWRKRKITQMMEELKEEDTLMISENCRPGRSMRGIMEVLSVATQKRLAIYAVKGEWHLDGSIQSKVVAIAKAIAAAIERDLISQRMYRGTDCP